MSAIDGIFESAVGNTDSYAQVVQSGLGVFNKYVEVTILVEDAGVQQFILRRLAAL